MPKRVRSNHLQNSRHSAKTTVQGFASDSATSSFVCYRDIVRYLGDQPIPVIKFCNSIAFVYVSCVLSTFVTRRHRCKDDFVVCQFQTLFTRWSYTMYYSFHAEVVQSQHVWYRIPEIPVHAESPNYLRLRRFLKLNWLCLCTF